MKLLRRDDLVRSIGMASALDAMRRAFAAYSSGLADVPMRTQIPIPHRAGVTLFMPGYLREDGALGCKLASIRPENRRAGLPTIQAVMILLDEATGAPIALLEAGYLTTLRTGAASGVATDLLSRADARVLACIGAGEQAETQIEAVCAVRRIDRVWIRSRSEESARSLVSRIKGERGIPDDVRVAESPGQALGEADVVCTATTSHTPVFDGRDVRPGTHINAIGSSTPEAREVDSETLRAAKIVVDSRAACAAEAGDLLRALEEGGISGPESWTELGEILLGCATGRRGREEVTYFKSVGLAIQDLAVARAAFHEAERLSIGQEFGGFRAGS
jgi:ornithine cyclodeaminase